MSSKQQPGFFRRAIQAIDTASRVNTVLGLFGLAAGVGVVAATVVRAVTRLPLSWLILLGCGAGLLILIVTALLVAPIVGGHLRMSQRIDTCWVSPNPDGGGAVLTGSFHLRNSGQDRP